MPLLPPVTSAIFPDSFAMTMLLSKKVLKVPAIAGAETPSNHEVLRGVRDRPLCRRGDGKTGERPRDAQVRPQPGQEGEDGLDDKRLALGHVQADGAAPETTGQQDAQGRGAGDEEENSADQFSGADNLNRHAQAELFDLLRREEAEDFGRSCAPCYVK